MWSFKIIINRAANEVKLPANHPFPLPLCRITLVNAIGLQIFYRHRVYRQYTMTAAGDSGAYYGPGSNPAAFFQDDITYHQIKSNLFKVMVST